MAMAVAFPFAAQTNENLLSFQRKVGA